MSWGWKTSRSHGHRYFAFWLALAFFSQCAIHPAAVLAFDRPTVEPSVVRIVTNNGSGTGFLISGKRVFATNHHVVDGSETVSIQFLQAGALKKIEARVLRVFPDRDLAILETVEDGPGAALTLAVEDPLKGLSDLPKVIALGFPGVGDTGSDISNAVPGATTGVISKFVPDFKKLNDVKIKIVQHSASIYPGNSGGPLFDDCGHVVGINTAVPYVNPGQSDQMAQSINLSVHASELSYVLKEMRIAFSSTSAICSPSTVDKYGRFYLFAGSAALLSCAALLLIFHRRPELAPKAYRDARGSFTELLRKERRPAPVPTVVLPTGAAPPRVGDRDDGLHKAAESSGGVVPTVMHDIVGHDDAVVLEPLGGAGKRIEMKRNVLRSGGILIGRSPGCDIQISDRSIGRQHARLTLDGTGQLVVQDLHSANGTWIGTSRIDTATIGEGQVVRFGRMSYRSAKSQTGSSGRSDWYLKPISDSYCAFPVALSFSQSSTREFRVGTAGSLVDGVLNDKTVSSQHAVFSEGRSGTLMVADLNSTNGTYVDDRKIGTTAVQISPGSKIRMGRLEYELNKR